MADSPVEAEASQALFCAVADYVGSANINNVLNLEEFPTYQSLTGYPLKQNNPKEKRKLTPEQVEHQILINDSFKKTATPGVDLVRMEKFLDSKPSWYESSILTAKALIKEIDKYDKNNKFKFQNIGWQDFFYVRGATSGNTAMDNIEKLFAIANASNQYKVKPFGDVNKWSPADIYFVSSDAARHIAYKLVVEMNAEPTGGGKRMKDLFGFDELNLFINDLIESGDLLPVSLKKTKNSATIYPYNFDRDAQEIYFSTIKYYDISRRKSYKRTPQSAALPYKSVSPVTRDIKIYFNGGKKDKIKIRHDSYHNKFGVNKALKVEIEVTGAGGRGGSFVGFNRLKDIIDDVSPVLGTTLMKKWTAGLKRYEEELDLLNTRFGVAKDTPHSFLANKTTPQETIAKKERFKNQYLEYQAERAHLSALYIDNYIYPVLENWFVFNSVSAQKLAFSNILLKRFIEYASSRSPKSGKFVIAK
tara:strand:+ start:28 stop:1452 length:1425 start_codon:yes stop_codon:yes gene_type:complete